MGSFFRFFTFNLSLKMHLLVHSSLLINFEDVSTVNQTSPSNISKDYGSIQFKKTFDLKRKSDRNEEEQFHHHCHQFLVLHPYFNLNFYYFARLKIHRLILVPSNSIVP